MRRSLLVAATLASFLVAGASRAQDTQTDAPPADMKPLSEIIAKVEKRDAFRYIEQVRWNNDGYYEVTYFTNDKARVEMNYSPVTAEPQ